MNNTASPDRQDIHWIGEAEGEKKKGALYIMHFHFGREIRKKLDRSVRSTRVDSETRNRANWPAYIFIILVLRQILDVNEERERGGGNGRFLAGFAGEHVRAERTEESKSKLKFCY